MQKSLSEGLPAVTAMVAYLSPDDHAPEVRVYPLSSGRATVRPRLTKYPVRIHDVRSRAAELRLDEHGFEFHRRPTTFSDFYTESEVKERYYADVRRAMLEFTGALEVVVFDHNVRSAVRAARGDTGVRIPVEHIHNDYTAASGPKRKLEILEGAGRLELAKKRVAFVNLWRPIISPVQDNPLALCNAKSVANADLVPTYIRHFGEADLDNPRHTGEIYSVRHRDAHEWFYASDMTADEVLLLKCYDSLDDGRARFMPHTGFSNPACPPEFTPRESIEARTLVVYNQDA